jgi:diguanylate cyclase (GGDEF)-like protein
LRSALRDYDSLGRYGGDEFLAVIPGCDPAGIASFAESFRSRISSEAVDTPEGPVSISMSLGVAAVENLPEVKAETLVKIADAALYRAKLAGRNCAALATEEEIEKEIALNVDAPAKTTHGTLISELPISSPPI